MITIYSTNTCPSCVAAKRLFDDKNIEYKMINIEEENISREDLQEISGKYTVPQIIINNKCIGGYTQLLYLHQNNELDKILNDK